jgi:oligosaccharide translocation protein RFT1
METHIRVRAEGIGVVLKSIATFLVLLLDARVHDTPGEWALLAFAAGQLVYGATSLVVYVSYYGVDPLLPKSLSG